MVAIRREGADVWRGRLGSGVPSIDGGEQGAEFSVVYLAARHPRFDPALPDAEVERIYERHVADYAHAGFTRERLLQAVRRTRSTGHADIVDTLTTGVSGVGCTFAASQGTLAAISFGAISPRLPPERKLELAQLLKAELPIAT